MSNEEYLNFMKSLNRIILKGPNFGKTILERFHQKYTINKNGCWEWNEKDLRGKRRGDYGVLKINQKRISAHRLSYMIYKGNIPDEMLICHTCDNTKCVNPNHLFKGTHIDNMRDKINKNRSNNIKGEMISVSKLKEKQVLEAREEYNNSDISIRQLSKKYNISPSSMRDIIMKIAWKHI